jgi:hypothetical protein
MGFDADQSRRSGSRGCVIAIVLMLLAIFICATGTTLFLDNRCHTLITRWMPLYPDGEIISQTHSFLRPFGLGRTEVVMEVPETSTEIRTWFNEERARRGAVPDGVVRKVSLNFEPVAEGSRMTYFAYCTGF